MKLKHAELGNLHQLQEELQRLMQESEHFNNPNFTFNLEGVYRGVGDIITLNKIWDDRIGEKDINPFEEMRMIFQREMKEQGYTYNDVLKIINNDKTI